MPLEIEKTNMDFSKFKAMSTQSSNNNKRIAKNTLFLYMRMFVMMLTALFTSRIVLDVLGAADYGLNNVFIGALVLFSFLNAALLSVI